MIGHDDECMQLESLKLVLPILQGLDHKFGDFPAAQMQRTARTPIQKPVHRHECLSRQRQAGGREDAMRWKSTVQTESDKQRLLDCIPVREPPFVVPHSR